ncbi:MAG: hypothetical protein JWO83_247 [Caulobacteraceae bacterium]|jgi:hypothetical protein|nr:hypothetical protein [Caulobacteraceae bacterium]
MQITLFRALQGIKVGDDEAEAVVDRLETHVESVVNNNIKAVEAKLAGLQATLDALRSQIQFVTVMLGVIGLAIAAGPIIAKFIR